MFTPRSVRFHVLALALSLLAGCAGPHRVNHPPPSLSEINATPPTALQPAQPQPKSPPDTQAYRLHPGDIIVISIDLDGPPPGVRIEPMVRTVAEDGAVDVWDNGVFHIPVAGLTMTEAASKIRTEIIMKYTGVNVRVKVKLQSHVEANVRQPLRPEDDRESAARSACDSGLPLNVPQPIPRSAHHWKMVTRSPGTNQPAIRFRDKCNPLWWFGNVDEPIAPDWYRPGKTDRNFRYHLRNPCHNFFFYVMGIADKTFRRAGKYPSDNFSPRGGWNLAASNYKYLCLWLPFISYEHRGFQFYIGWRNGGNFGIKLRYSKLHGGSA